MIDDRSIRVDRGVDHRSVHEDQRAALGNRNVASKNTVHVHRRAVENGKTAVEYARDVARVVARNFQGALEQAVGRECTASHPERAVLYAVADSGVIDDRFDRSAFVRSVGKPRWHELKVTL